MSGNGHKTGIENNISKTLQKPVVPQKTPEEEPKKRVMTSNSIPLCENPVKSSKEVLSSVRLTIALATVRLPDILKILILPPITSVFGRSFALLRRIRDWYSIIPKISIFNFFRRRAGLHRRCAVIA
jgi:hypothetical protein